MMKHPANFLRAASAVMVLAAAGIASNVQAQGANPGPAGANTNQAGEAFPNDPNAANKNKPTAGIVQKTENSRPVQATKRVAKRTANAVKRAGHKTANALRNTGEKIGDKVPPGPNDAKK
jgi:hypothetical protein